MTAFCAEQEVQHFSIHEVYTPKGQCMYINNMSASDGLTFKRQMCYGNDEWESSLLPTSDNPQIMSSFKWKECV